ncbi:hypothetical protein GWI33_016733 [Rhynchophorus ferrugineus]|uniref:Uncharacterized protein n=1 Tax=Rhynchophorus ferrugineus TaxID=354439 RepID=A0A834M318_RHYFE|nr:hypothetical protein GWI33_016733 [Rhynchophorus ferrugineus]
MLSALVSPARTVRIIRAVSTLTNTCMHNNPVAQRQIAGRSTPLLPSMEMNTAVANAAASDRKDINKRRGDQYGDPGVSRGRSGSNDRTIICMPRSGGTLHPFRTDTPSL